MEGHLPIIKFLVAQGPSASCVLESRNDDGETPKNLAQRFFKQDVVEYISHIEWERDCPEEVKSLAFPAHIAAANDDLNQLRELIENGVVNINERDEHGATLLHKGLHFFYYEIKYISKGIIHTLLNLYTSAGFYLYIQ